MEFEYSPRYIFLEKQEIGNKKTKKLKRNKKTIEKMRKNKKERNQRVG